MRKGFASILILWFLALGSGTLEYLHNLQHAIEDAQEDARQIVFNDHPNQPTSPVEHHHDDSNCDVHAQLHMPLLPVGWAPLLILFGLFVAVLNHLLQSLISRLIPACRYCRGPPALMHLIPRFN